jgi:hypothetical protein
MPTLIKVSLSRKLSKDFQSKGFALEITGELPATAIDDPQAMAQASNHLFQLATDLLDAQIGNGQADQPIAAVPATHAEQTRRAPAATVPTAGNGHQRRNGNGQPRLITEAQVRALRSMAQKLDDHEDRIAQDEFGVTCSQLTIKQASELIDKLKKAIETSSLQETSR